jgi:hypothetical protein
MQRREFLVFALAGFLAKRGFASDPAREFLRRVNEASRDLLAQPAQWQEAVEAAARAVDLADLRRSIEFDKLAPPLAQHDTQGGDSVLLKGVGVSCAAKLFCLRKGDAITPHGHRNMMSMHLVLGGELHVRHFEKLGDDRASVPAKDGLAPAGGHLLLRPTIDRTARPGDATSVSPARDNVHWFVAQSRTAYTFDCIVSDLAPAGYSYGIDLVDPAGAERLPDGTLRARVIGWDESLRRYGHA